jgi:hypothetical protein
MSEHRLNGLIIWGFLRDNHGGIQAAQELCRYANERGVKIIPGVNIDRNYGGFYHEGDHEFNMETRAQKYPHLRSMDENGKYLPRTLCAEKGENRDWLRRGIRWLFDTFPSGGISRLQDHRTHNRNCGNSCRTFHKSSTGYFLSSVFHCSPQPLALSTTGAPILERIVFSPTLTS